MRHDPFDFRWCEVSSSQVFEIGQRSYELDVDSQFIVGRKGDESEASGVGEVEVELLVPQNWFPVLSRTNGDGGWSESQFSSENHPESGVRGEVTLSIFLETESVGLVSLLPGQAGVLLFLVVQVDDAGRYRWFGGVWREGGHVRFIRSYVGEGALGKVQFCLLIVLQPRS